MKPNNSFKTIALKSYFFHYVLLCKPTLITRFVSKFSNLLAIGGKKELGRVQSAQHTLTALFNSLF